MPSDPAKPRNNEEPELTHNFLITVPNQNLPMQIAIFHSVLSQILMKHD
jgi:hypothetical protein